MGAIAISDGINDIESDKETWKTITQSKTDDHHEVTDYYDIDIADNHAKYEHNDVSMTEGLS